MNIILRFIALFSVFSVLLISCDDKGADDIRNTDVNKMVSFAQDTFFLQENVGDTTIVISLPKYVNGKSTLILGCTDGTALRDSNFIIEELEAIIPVGSDKVRFPISLINDTIMNSNREFTLDLLSVSGAAYAGTMRQKCIVVIVNDDFPKEATAVFTHKKVEVYEGGKVVEIPFKIIRGDLKGDASVTFTSESGIGTATNDNFSLRDNGVVSLKKGELSGVLTVDIYDNVDENETLWTSIFMSESEGVFIGEESCRLNILDDDITRTIGFTVPTVTVAEDSKTVEISVAISGKPKFEKPIITGFIEFLSGKKGLAIVGDANFAVRGDTTITFDISIADNDVFEPWADTLRIRGYENVTLLASYDTLSIVVADDERRLRFDTPEFIVKEDAHTTGNKLLVPVVLEGGLALVDTEITLSIDPTSTAIEGNGASGGQYVLTDKVLTIPKGSDRVNAEVRVYHNTSPLDAFFILNVASEQDKVSIIEGEGRTCKVNITNVDMNVQFASIKSEAIFTDTDASLRSSSVSGLNIGSDINVNIEVVTTAGITYSGFKSALLSAGDISSVEFPFTVDFASGVNLGTVTVKISSITDGTGAVLDNVINTLLAERTYIVVNALETSGLAYINPVDNAWTNTYASTEETVGEGEGQGMGIHMIDNNNDTFWHSRWSTDGATEESPVYPTPPYTLIFDMQKSVLINKIEVAARNGSNDFMGAEIYVGDSSDEINDTWKLIMVIDNKTTPVMLSTGLATVIRSGRYLKVKINEARGDVGGYVAAIREIKIYGYQ